MARYSKQLVVFDSTKAEDFFNGETPFGETVLSRLYSADESASEQPKRPLARPYDLLPSQEPQNLMGINSYKYNGLVNKRAIGIEAAKDNKGAVMTLKTRKGMTVLERGGPLSKLNFEFCSEKQTGFRSSDIPASARSKTSSQSDQENVHHSSL